LDFCGELKVFEAAVHNIITFFIKADGTNNIPLRRLHQERFGNVTELSTQLQQELTYRAFFPDSGCKNACFEAPCIPLEKICYVSVGMVIHANEKIAKGAFLTEDLISNTQDEIHPKAFAEGKNLERWFFASHNYLEWNTERAPVMFRRPTFPELYDHPEKLMLPMVGDIRAALDNQQMLCNHGIFVCVPWYSLAGVRNNSLRKSARYDNETPKRDDLPRRNILEVNSRKFSIKYLLAIMNSSVARDFLREHRRNNVQLYPDDWKKLPIPDVDTDKQIPIIMLVDQILSAKSADPKADITELESQLDSMVSVLYCVTD